MFLLCSILPDSIRPMSEEPPLHPADPDAFRRSLAFALTFDGRRQFKTSGEMMAKITAEHLASHLEMSGYVIMKRPPGPAHSTPGPKPDGQR